MGVALTELLLIKEIDLEFLYNKVLVVDAPMWLYQFLSSIRQRDGSLLTDSKGNVTSHLIGLLSRISNLIQKNVKLAFVFDGEPPKLKHLTLEKRKEIKLESEKNLEKAKEKRIGEKACFRQQQRPAENNKILGNCQHPRHCLCFAWRNNACSKTHY